MRLAPLPVEFSTIIAKAEVVCTNFALPTRDVASRRTAVVVVMDPLNYGLVDFVD